MTKTEIKELIAIIFIGLINILISFTITALLGISNTVVIKTFSVMYGDITWEVIIFMSLSIILASIYEYLIKPKAMNSIQ